MCCEKKETALREQSRLSPRLQNCQSLTLSRDYLRLGIFFGSQVRPFQGISLRK